MSLVLDSRAQVCVEHGVFESVNLFAGIWSKCPACSKAERLVAERLATENKRREDGLRWARLVAGAGIPERFVDRTFDSYRADCDDQRAALSLVKSFASADSFDRGRNLILCGRPGTGKTHLAVAVGLRAMSMHKRVMFTTVLRAIRRVRDAWAKGARETESQAVAVLVSADLLILDEVGVQYGTDAERNILFDVINERYERRRSTILISNLDLDGVKAAVGERVFDRMREDGGVYVPFCWDSYRGVG